MGLRGVPISDGRLFRRRGDCKAWVVGGEDARKELPKSPVPTQIVIPADQGFADVVRDGL